MRTISTLLLLVSLAGRADESSAGPLRFSEVYLGFAEEHAADLVSGFGHAFVCLPARPARSADELLTAPAVNFAADTSGAGEGIWQARFRLRTCYELLRTNTYFQQRDVYFIRLKLDEAARARLAEGLVRRTGHALPYDFLRSNCGANLAEWILEAAGRPQEIPRPLLYITPRESIERVIDTVGADGLLIARSSASRVAVRAANLSPEATEQARSAIRDTGLTAAITDPWLRLEVIRLNESRVDPEAYKELQSLRRTTLLGPDGTEAAKAMSGASNESLQPMSSWIRSKEGPGMTFGLLSDNAGQAGFRLGIEAGLRDADTTPSNEEARREVHLLGLEVDHLGDRYRTKATLIAIHSERNLPGIFGGGSSGFEVGYIDRPNFEGTHGINLETWSGLYALWGRGVWTGLRATLRADDIQGSARIRLLPSLSSSAKIGTFTLAATLVLDQGDLGYRFEASTRLADSTLRLSLEHAPDRQERICAALSTRF